MTDIQQTAADRATWPVKEPGSVMMAWRHALSVIVTEVETNALLKLAVSPKYLPLSFDYSVVRIMPHEAAEWAYRALGELRGERLDGERL